MIQKIKTTTLNIFIIFILLSGCNLANYNSLPETPDNKKSEKHQPNKETKEVNKKKDTPEQSYQAFKNKNYNKVVELIKPQYKTNLNYKTKFIYAESLRLTGQLSEAEKTLNEILSLKKNNINALESLGLIYLEQSKLNKAADIFYKSLESDATRNRSINALGIIYSIQGKTEEANSFYELSLSLSKNKPSVKNNFGLMKILSGEISEGITMLEEAKKETTDYKLKKLISNNLGLAYSLKGETKKAKKILSEYYSEPEVLNNLGIYENLKNNKTSSKKYFKNAISSNPTYYEKAWDNFKKVNAEKEENTITNKK